MSRNKIRNTIVVNYRQLNIQDNLGGIFLSNKPLKDEILNKVANSALITFNLEDIYPTGPRLSLDISQWLLEGIVLREKNFRDHVKNHDWSQYKDAFVSIYCSTDAIIPGWAFMLVSLQINTYAKKAVIGDAEVLESILFSEILNTLDISEYENKLIIIKGCANKPIPQNAYVLLAQKLQAVAKSIMYGEACSAVPLFKKSK